MGERGLPLAFGVLQANSGWLVRVVCALHAALGLIPLVEGPQPVPYVLKGLFQTLVWQCVCLRAAPILLFLLVVVVIFHWSNVQWTHSAPEFGVCI